MTIQALPDACSVCKVADESLVDRETMFCFTGRTDAERSLVCRTQDVPDNVTAREDGWRAFPLCWPKTGSASSCSRHMTPITF